MTTFDDGKYKQLLHKKSMCNVFNAAFVTALIILAVLSAVLSTGAEKGDGNFTAFVTAIALFAVFLAIFIGGNLFFVSKVNSKLKGEIAKSITDEMTSTPSLLTGGNEVKLRVTYADECLTVERVNAVREVTVGKSGGLLKGGSKAQFGLKDMRRVQSVFTRFGEWVLQFVEAYYAVNCNFTAVSVLDETGKTVEEITLIEGGKPVYQTENNYFLKNGLIK